MTIINLPKTNQTGSNEWADVEDNDTAIINVVNGSLDNNNLASNAAIAHSKLASIPTGSVLLGNGGTPTSTALTGDVTVNASGVTTISNSVVTEAKINNLAVTTAKIDNLAITEGKVADSAITSAKIANGTIATADIANNAVTADKLPTADAAALGLNTTAVTTQRGKATNNTERSTTGFTVIPSLSFTLTLPTVGFILYGIKADLKGSGSGIVSKLAVGQGGLTTATNNVEISVTGTTYTTKSAVGINGPYDFMAATESSVSVGAILLTGGSGTAYAKNITVWAMALEVA